MGNYCWGYILGIILGLYIGDYILGIYWSYIGVIYWGYILGITLGLYWGFYRDYIGKLPWSKEQSAQVLGGHRDTVRHTSVSWATPQPRRLHFPN